jgi:cytochrome c oxidase subunit 3
VAVATSTSERGSGTIGEPRDARVAVGAVLFLASEVLLFAGLFGAYFTLRAANEVWPPKGDDLDLAPAALFTAVFAASALTMWLALRAAREGRGSESNWLLAITAVLGLAFLVETAVGLATLDFGLTTDAYGSIVVMTIGIHAAHVLTALLIVALVAYATMGDGRAPRVLSRHAAAYFWWFTVAMSAAVFVVVYLIQ